MIRHRGISYSAQNHKYHVRVHVAGKQKHVGRYDTLQEAIEARNDFMELHDIPWYRPAEENEFTHGPLLEIRHTKQWFVDESKRQLKELPLRYA